MKQWKHFPRYWPLCEGKPPVTGGFPSQRPMTRSFGVFFGLNGWANNRDASDFRRHRAHYDVTTILTPRYSSPLKILGGRAFSSPHSCRILFLDSSHAAMSTLSKAIFLSSRTVSIRLWLSLICKKTGTRWHLTVMMKWNGMLCICLFCT